MFTFFKKPQAGFTFIELVVVISIVAIISSVLIFNYGQFDANIKLKNLAQDIALQIKQAQTVAISGGYGKVFSYEFQGQELAGQAPTYGIWFDFADTTTGGEKGFAFFVDIPGTLSTGGTIEYSSEKPDGIITDPQEGCLNPNDPNSICTSRNVCGLAGDENQECLAVTKITSLDRISWLGYNKGGSLTQLGTLGITFVRPSPRAIFTQFTNNKAEGLGEDVSEVYIEVQSLRDRTKCKHITVYASGQIAVNDGPVPNNPNPSCI